MKFVLVPISLLGGLLAGTISKKIFAKLWSVFDDEEAPDAKHRYIDYRKLVPALLIEGAIFRLLRGFVDHGTRHGIRRLTGAWPGEEAPEPK